MGAAQRITVDLPEEMADRLRERISAGEFATESDAIVEALLALDCPMPTCGEVDTWLHGPVAEAYDAVKNGTAVIYSSEEARKRLGVSG